MKAPLSKLILHRTGCGFVDDTQIMYIGLDEEGYWTVVRKLQEALYLDWVAHGRLTFSN